MGVWGYLYFQLYFFVIKAGNSSLFSGILINKIVGYACRISNKNSVSFYKIPRNYQTALVRTDAAVWQQRRPSTSSSAVQISRTFGARGVLALHRRRVVFVEVDGARLTRHCRRAVFLSRRARCCNTRTSKYIEYIYISVLVVFKFIITVE